MLLTVEQTKEKIADGKVLYVAADEKLLDSLPEGEWIGGTIPYFMDEPGGTSSKEKVFVVEREESVLGSVIKWYDERNIEKVAAESPDQGFSIIIIPATSAVHVKYAEEAPGYDNIYHRQIVGWVSGIDLNDFGKVTPKVINGETGEFSENKAIVLHAVLPVNKQASIGIVNIFKQGYGDTFTFRGEGFEVQDVEINGIRQNFADYLKSNKIDFRLPLVADYNGAMVNVSLKGIVDETNAVEFYAPVFEGIEYKFAAPVDDFVEAFQKNVPRTLVTTPQFACNCVLNYMYSELEGKKVGTITGPMTFGEIAHQLLNQTLVYLQIQDK